MATHLLCIDSLIFVCAYIQVTNKMCEFVICEFVVVSLEFGYCFIICIHTLVKTHSSTLKVEAHFSNRQTIESLHESNRLLAQQLRLLSNSEPQLKKEVTKQGETIQRMNAHYSVSPLSKKIESSADDM